MDDIPVNGRPLATIPVLVQGKKNSYQILRPDDSGKEYELFDPQSEKVTDSLENKSLKIDALIPLPIGKEELLAIDEAREV